MADIIFAPKPSIVYIFPILIIILVILGIILAIKSSKIRSKSLKVGIYLPLIIYTIGFLWWLGDLINIVDFDTYLIIVGSFMIFLIIGIISVTSSIIALKKRKPLAAWSLAYGIVMILVWIYLFANIGRG